MRILNKDYALKGKGYSETDYYKAAESVAGMSLQDFFNNYIYSPADYEPQLNTVLAYAGLELTKRPSNVYFERYFGFKVIQDALATKVTTIIPGSVACLAGISKDDEVISINGFRVENNLAEWCTHFDGPIVLEVLTQKQVRSIKLTKTNQEYYAKVNIQKMDDANTEQKAFFQHWCNQSY
jgi:predicted metalloprotease with PDZ domain